MRVSVEEVWWHFGMAETAKCVILYLTELLVCNRFEILKN